MSRRRRPQCPCQLTRPDRDPVEHVAQLVDLRIECSVFAFERIILIELIDPIALSAPLELPGDRYRCRPEREVTAIAPAMLPVPKRVVASIADSQRTSTTPLAGMVASDSTPP